MDARCTKCNKEDMLVNEYEKQNENSNMIGYRSLFYKNNMGHLQVLNTNTLLFLFLPPLSLFTMLHLRIQTKGKIILNTRWPLYYFLGINFYIPLTLKVNKLGIEFSHMSQKIMFRLYSFRPIIFND